MGLSQGAPGLLDRVRPVPANSSFSSKCLLIEMQVSWGLWGHAPASGKDG